MFLDKDLKVRFQPVLKSQVSSDGLAWLLNSEGKQVRLPRKFKPDLALIAAHASSCRTR